MLVSKLLESMPKVLHPNGNSKWESWKASSVETICGWLDTFSRESVKNSVSMSHMNLNPSQETGLVQELILIIPPFNQEGREDMTLLSKP